MLLTAQFGDGRGAGFPRLALDPADKLRPDAIERVDGMHVSEFGARRQQRRDVFRQASQAAGVSSADRSTAQGQALR